MWTSSKWGSHVDTTDITGAGSYWALISEVVQIPSDSVDFCYDLRMLALEWNGEVVLIPFTDLFEYEVINLKSANQDLLVTHCPLTKTTMIFDDPTEAMWHPSGYLMHDNLIFQDTAQNRRTSQLGQFDLQPGAGNTLSWELYPSIELPFWLAVQSFPSAKVLLASHKGAHNTVCEVYDNSYSVTSYMWPSHASRSDYREVNWHHFEDYGEVVEREGTTSRIFGYPEWDIMAIYDAPNSLNWDTTSNTLYDATRDIHFDLLGRPVDASVPKISVVPGMFVLPQAMQEFFPDRNFAL